MHSLIKKYSSEYLTVDINRTECVVKITEVFLFGKIRLLYKEEGSANQAKVRDFKIDNSVKTNKIGFEATYKNKDNNENKGKKGASKRKSSRDK